MEYTSFECGPCKKEFILNTDEFQSSVRRGTYITCPYCNSKRIKRIKQSDSIKECMKERSYKRSKHGALVQK